MLKLKEKKNNLDAEARSLTLDSMTTVWAICYLLEAEGSFWSGEAPCKRSALATYALHTSMVSWDMFHARNFSTAQLLSHWNYFASSPFYGWFLRRNLDGLKPFNFFWVESIWLRYRNCIKSPSQLIPLYWVLQRHQDPSVSVFDTVPLEHSFIAFRCWQFWSRIASRMLKSSLEFLYHGVRCCAVRTVL
jgi:hypothetical protein